MGWYRGDGIPKGDYYRGDYYRGDPFLGGIIKAVAGKSLKKAGGWLKGRVFGAAKKSAKRLVTLATEYGPGAARDVVVGSMGYKMGQQQGKRVEDMNNEEYHDMQEARRGGRSGWWDGHYYGARRKMNPLNPKALNRALRRAQGFEKFARKTVNALYKTVDGRRVKTFKRKGK